jgi:hypothetical protein
MGIDLQDSQPTEVNQMLAATLILLCAIPQAGEAAKALALEPAADSAKNALAAQPLPSMPTPKVAMDADASGSRAVGTVSANATPAAEAIEPRVAPMPIQAVKPAYVKIGETPRQRKVWYTLVATGHGAAAFDAYSTRRAISQGYGQEGNPLLRPFSHSGAFYAATQVSPAVMDYIGKRMMVSPNPWIRKLWWLPQAAGTGISMGAGVHNMNVVP